MAKKTKADKIWAYKIRHPKATTREIATATKSSYNYVHALMSKIGTPKEVFEKEANKVTRANILDTAKEYVTKDRAADHGDMEDNFKITAEYWSLHLGVKVDAIDVAVMMNLLKVARIKSNPKHPDNWVDACGYMACGGELAGRG